MGRIIVINKCCCCGGKVESCYSEGDEVGRAYAEACDVCVKCYRDGCKTLTGDKCNITNEKQVQLKKVGSE